MDNQEYVYIKGTVDCYRPTDFIIGDESSFSRRETITVGDLISILEEYDDDSPIMIQFDNGNSFGRINRGTITSEDSDDFDESKKIKKSKIFKKISEKKNSKIKESEDEREIVYCHRCFDYTDDADVPCEDIVTFPLNMSDEEIIDELDCSDIIDTGDDFVFWVKDNKTGKMIWENSSIDEESWIEGCVNDGTDPYVFLEAGYDYDFLQDYIDEEDEDDDFEDDDFEESAPSHKHFRESSLMEYDYAVKPYEGERDFDISTSYHDTFESRSDLQAFCDLFYRGDFSADTDEELIDQLVEDELLDDSYLNAPSSDALEALCELENSSNLYPDEEFVFYLRNKTTEEIIYKNRYAKTEEWRKYDNSSIKEEIIDILEPEVGFKVSKWFANQILNFIMEEHLEDVYTERFFEEYAGSFNNDLLNVLSWAVLYQDGGILQDALLKEDIINEDSLESLIDQFRQIDPEFNDQNVLDAYNKNEMEQLTSEDVEDAE